MSGWTIGMYVAAGLGTLIALVGALGVVALSDGMARLHAAALVAAVAPIFFAVAVCLHEGVTAGTAKGLLALWIVVSGSAALTHASAASIRDWRTRRHRA